MIANDRGIQREVVDLYHRGLSTYRVGELLGIGRQRVTRILHEAGIPVAPRGRGRPRPDRRLPAPLDFSALLVELYRDQKISSREIGAKLGMSERTVRNRLAELGIATRTKGGWNREDRRALDPATVEQLYVQRGESAEQVGAVLGASRRLVLRTLHERGLAVRSGGPLDEADIRLVRSLYADRGVARVLARHGVPVVLRKGPIWARFRVPVPLSRELLSDLYVGCGLALSHIELLTGQPGATVRRRLMDWGIPMRGPGGRSPFLGRLIDRKRAATNS